MKKYIKVRKRSGSILLAAILSVTMLSIEGLSNIFVISEKNSLEVQAAVSLNNPIIEEDSSMESGQNVTWDCIWFGSYPQTEVVLEGSDEEAKLEWMNDYSETKYESLSQNEFRLIENGSYNENGEAVINGEKYKRIKQSDAVYVNPIEDNEYFYQWADDTSYHYFKYEPIKWRVLEVSENDVFLLSDIALDNRQYNTTQEGITWEKSTIRSWLNSYSSEFNNDRIDYTENGFINSAFTDEEKNAIYDSNIINDDNEKNGTDGGNNTTDKIFLLSEKDCFGENANKKGFISDIDIRDEAKWCKRSTYAFAQGILTETGSSDLFKEYKNNVSWLLRSPGMGEAYAQFIQWFGSGAQDGACADDADGVRPALHLNISDSGTYSYAGTVCSDGTIDEIDPDDMNGENATSDYNTDVVELMANKNVMNAIRYLCIESNFQNSIYVHENDAAFASLVTMALSDVYYRGLDGWKDLFAAETSTQSAEKIIASLLKEYDDDIKELTLAKNSQKYAGIFVKGLSNYLDASHIESLVDNKDINKLERIISEDKVAESLYDGEYNKLVEYFQNEGGYSKDSEIVKILDQYMNSSELAESLSKEVDFLDKGLTFLTVTKDTITYICQLNSLCEADEIYCEMLLYLEEKCPFEVVQDASRNLYNVIHGSYLDQIEYASSSIANEVESAVVDKALDLVVKEIPYLNIIKEGFDWGVNLSNYYLHIGDTQELKDNMRIEAYLGQCLSSWVINNQTEFLQSSEGAERENDARKLYYSMYMLWKTRIEGEKTLQGMMETAYMDFWSKYYTYSVGTLQILESYNLFSAEMQQLMLVTVSCPVDVQIFNSEGKLITTIQDGKEIKGQNQDVTYLVKYNLFEDDYIKAICFPEGSGYILKYKGMDMGTVDSMVTTLENDGVSSSQYFENVVVHKNDIITVKPEKDRKLVYHITDLSTGETKEKEFYSMEGSYVEAQQLELTESSKELICGEQNLLSATIYPEEASDKNIIWKSSNENIVTVNSDGVVAAKAEGTAIVTASLYDSTLKADCLIVVKNKSSNLNDEKIPATNNDMSNGDTDYNNNLSKNSGQSIQQEIKKPKKVTRFKASFKKGKILCSWKKIKKIDGYEIQCSLNKKFRRKTSSKYLSKRTKRLAIKGVKKNKKYYLRIRAYKWNGGIKVFGKWSKIKKIKSRNR